MLLPNTVTHSSQRSHSLLWAGWKWYRLSLFKEKSSLQSICKCNSPPIHSQTLQGDLRLSRSLRGRAMNLPSSARSHKAGHCATSANSGHENMSQPSIWLHSSANSYKSKRKISMFGRTREPGQSPRQPLLSLAGICGRALLRWPTRWQLFRSSTCRPWSRSLSPEGKDKERTFTRMSQAGSAHITTFKVQDAFYCDDCDATAIVHQMCGMLLIRHTLCRYINKM